MSRVTIYREGFIVMSVCAPKDMTAEQVIADVEAQQPCGTMNGWGISSDEWLNRNEQGEPVKTGRVGPIPCDKDPERIHWLLTA